MLNLGLFADASARRLLNIADPAASAVPAVAASTRTLHAQDVQELMSQDLADALQQMHEKGRYNELLLMVETCEAATLVDKISAPNIVATASSVLGGSHRLLASTNHL